VAAPTISLMGRDEVNKTRNESEMIRIRPLKEEWKAMRFRVGIRDCSGQWWREDLIKIIAEFQPWEGVCSSL